MESSESYVCTVCGYVYDPAQHDKESGVLEGTAFIDIPENWLCPICGAPKTYFKEATRAD